MYDQAERLRALADTYRSRIEQRRGTVGRGRAHAIAVASGKGGVGKSNLSVNLSIALGQLGHDVILFDADLGLSNADVLLGAVPPYNLSHLIRGEKTMGDLLYATHHNLRLISGCSGLSELANLSEFRVRDCVEQLRGLDTLADYIIMDTAAGLSHGVLSFALAADTVLVITTPEPTALADAYALIKTVVRRCPAAAIRLVMNQVEDQYDADLAMQRLVAAAERFLEVAPEPLGFVPRDRRVQRAVKRQVPFIIDAPGTPAARAVVEIARRLTGAGDQPRANMFFDRLQRVFAGLGPMA